MRRTAKSTAESELGSWLNCDMQARDRKDEAMVNRASDVIYVLCNVLGLEKYKVMQDKVEYIRRYRPDIYNDFYDFDRSKAPLLLEMARKRGVDAQEAYNEFTETYHCRAWEALKNAAGIRYITEVER